CGDRTRGCAPHRPPGAKPQTATAARVQPFFPEPTGKRKTCYRLFPPPVSPSMDASAAQHKTTFSGYEKFVIAVLTFLQFTVILDVMILSPSAHSSCLR